MLLTWYDSNSWLIEIAGKRILLDPWFVGPLVFGNFDWLIQGVKKTPYPIPERIDLILLSQGLEDHAHPETLKQLDRNITVVISPNAEKVVKELGFTKIIALQHGQKWTFANALEINALPGSPIGPQLVENGYLLKDLATHYTLYYEPHGYHSPTLKNFAPVDIIMTPIIGIKLPLIGPVLKGQKATLEVCQWLNPQYVIHTGVGVETSFEGFLAGILSLDGTIADFQTLISKNNLSTQVIESKPGQLLAPQLKPREMP